VLPVTITGTAAGGYHPNLPSSGPPRSAAPMPEPAIFNSAAKHIDFNE
jgi:hypothetical protein